MSIPAGILIRAWFCQVVSGSAQASTVYVQRPGAPAVTVAPQRSVPGASSRIGVHGPARPAGSRSTTFAATAPCPSRNTVADTSKDSPVTALAGRRPCCTAGRTSRTGMRPVTGAGPGGLGAGDFGRFRSAGFFPDAVALGPGGVADEWFVAGMTAPVRVNVAVGG
ncbi:hypothetical protein STEPF1_06535 [Streptomyces sp. F-1]|nr:hypothetical protein STEPF1_06535 [Streptomyces sp. F-1]